MLNPNYRLNFFIGILAILIPTGSSVAVDFEQLINNPRLNKGKHVSVIGVAQVDGISFTLFQSPHRELSRTIFVGQKIGKPRYNNLDNHWVEITGIVDTDEEKIFACKVFLENVKLLPRHPVPGVKVFGVFLNQGPGAIELELFDKANQLVASSTLPQGDIRDMVIDEGQVEIRTPSDSLSAGKLLSACAVPSAKSAPGFLETSTRRFYFRIANGKIALVRPQEATGIKKQWEELEKNQ